MDRLLSAAFAFLLGALLLATLDLAWETRQLREDRSSAVAQAAANLALERYRVTPPPTSAGFVLGSGLGVSGGFVTIGPADGLGFTPGGSIGFSERDVTITTDGDYGSTVALVWSQVR